MTDSLVLQHLYFPNGPLVDGSFKLRLQVYRQRFRLFLTVSLTSIVHVLVFFTIAGLLRLFDLEHRSANIILSAAALLIVASMVGTTLPALIDHWRSESGLLVHPRGKIRVQKIPQMRPLKADFLFYLF